MARHGYRAESLRSLGPLFQPKNRRLGDSELQSILTLTKLSAFPRLPTQPVLTIKPKGDRRKVFF